MSTDDDLYQDCIANICPDCTEEVSLFMKNFFAHGDVANFDRDVAELPTSFADHAKLSTGGVRRRDSSLDQRLAFAKFIKG